MLGLETELRSRFDPGHDVYASRTDEMLVFIDRPEFGPSAFGKYHTNVYKSASNWPPIINSGMISEMFLKW